MALSLVCPITYLAQYNSTVFTGQGGVEPYVYSIESGGAGGSINASTGVYTSSGTTGLVTIRVTDAILATTTLTITIATALEMVCDIIRTEMGLASDQVYLWDQKFIIPKDFRLYIAVSVLNCKPFGNTNRFQSDGTSLQSINMQATLGVDIFSRSTDALLRKEEVLLALNSNYAESQEEINSFYVAPISTSFINLSEIDGAAIPYRFNISVNMQYFVKKSKAVPYYDDFSEVELVTEP